VVAQQDDGLDMEGLMKYPVPEDLNLSADTVKEPDDALAPDAGIKPDKDDKVIASEG
jgi:hypothetical protein